MDYALADELKTAGFPQDGEGKRIGPPDALYWRMSNRVYVPTLSELIEACAPFERLEHGQGEWKATSAMNGLTALGRTPAEAVARLWLALQQPRHDQPAEPRQP